MLSMFATDQGLGDYQDVNVSANTATDLFITLDMPKLGVEMWGR